MGYFAQDGGAVLMGIEASPGLDPGVGALTALPIEEPSTGSELETREINPVLPVAPGQLDVVLNETFQHSGTLTMRPVSVTGAASRPLQDILLRLCGFGQGVHAAGPPATVTYERDLFVGAETGTIYHYQRASDGSSNAILKKVHNARGTTTLSWSGDQDLQAQYEIQGETGSEADDVIPAIPTYADTNGDSRPSLSPLSATATLQSVEGAPKIYNGNLVSGEIQMGFETRRTKGIPVGTGTSSVAAVPGRTEGNFVIEARDLTSFDPRALARAQTPVRFDLQFVASDDVNDTLDITLWVQILSVAGGDEEGFATWELGWKGLWVDTGSGPGVDTGTTVRMVHTTN